MGHFIADAVYTRQVFYRKMGELKGARENTNGARGWKTDLYAV
jgi:hypothetical protein